MWKDKETKPWKYLLKECGFLIWTPSGHSKSKYYHVFLRYHGENNMDFRNRQLYIQMSALPLTSCDPKQVT